MTKISNIFGTTFSGRVGRKMVAGTWKGHEYIRPYVKPTDTKTESQMEQRKLFSQAVEAWHKLAPRQQEFYNRIADGMTGYNLFVKRHIEAQMNDMVPEVPIVMRWKTADGQPVEHGKLIVLQGNNQVFNDSLKDAVGEVALTPSDAPYTFMLKKGTQEENVLTIRDLGETDVPMVLESKTLGIKLVADVQAPPVGGASRVA